MFTASLGFLKCFVRITYLLNNNDVFGRSDWTCPIKTCADKGWRLAARQTTLSVKFYFYSATIRQWFVFTSSQQNTKQLLMKCVLRQLLQTSVSSSREICGGSVHQLRLKKRFQSSGHHHSIAHFTESSFCHSFCRTAQHIFMSAVVLWELWSWRQSRLGLDLRQRSNSSSSSLHS